MMDNINTNTMVGKVVAVCIALLFIVVLAFPVANSLSNMGKDDNGGPTIYTNTGDYYYNPTANDDAVHTVQLSAESENQTETTGSVTISLSVDDSVIYTDTDSWDDSTPTENSPTLVIIPIGWESDNIFAVNLNAFFFYEMNSMNPITPDIKIESSDSGAGDNPSLETPTYPSSSTSECSFTVQNGVITYTNDNDETVTSEYHMDYLITAGNSGEYVLADTPFKTDGNSMLYFGEVGYIDDSEHNMSFPVGIHGSMNTSVLTSSPVSVPIQFNGFEGTAQTTATFTFTNDNGLITVSNIESDISMTIPDKAGSYTVSDTVSLNAIVPTTVTVTPSNTNTHTVTYTNSGDYYYKSTTADSSEHIIDIEYTETRDGDAYDDSLRFITVLKIDGTIIINQSLGRGVDTYYLFGWSQSQTIGLSIQDGCMLVMNNADNTSEQLYGTFIEEITLEHGYTIHGQYVISDGVLSFTDNENVEHSYSIDYYMSGTGEYVLADTPVVSASDNTPIKLWINCVAEPINAPSPLTFSVYGTIMSGNIISDTESISLNVNDKLGEVISNTFESTLTSSRVGDLITLDNVSCEGQITTESSTYYGSASSTQFLVPTTVTVEEEGGGSDSAGLGSIASTLIKLVPILLIVSLLLVFIVPMVYKPN